MDKYNQWFDEVKVDLSEYNLSDEQINRIAADYELMAEAARLGEKYCINFLVIGSTQIIEGDNKNRYRHGSITGGVGLVAEDIAISMLHDPGVEAAVKLGMKLYRRYKKILGKED